MQGILVVGGYDPTGSAGVLEDSHIIRHHGIPAIFLASAFVYENTCRVIDVIELDLQKQLKLAKEENIQFKIVKIGLIYSKKQLSNLKEFLLEIKPLYVVFDPVTKASSNFRMSRVYPHDIIEFSRNLPVILTPNREEFSELFGTTSLKEASTENGLFIIVKGYRVQKEEVTDIVAFPDGKTLKVKHPDFKTHGIHGTGCTLSSLIATFLYKGFQIEEAYKKSIEEFEKLSKDAQKAGCQKIFI